MCNESRVDWHGSLGFIDFVASLSWCVSFVQVHKIQSLTPNIGVVYRLISGIDVIVFICFLIKLIETSWSR